jgi:hypothetical protein
MVKLHAENTIKDSSATKTVRLERDFISYLLNLNFSFTAYHGGPTADFKLRLCQPYENLMVLVADDTRAHPITYNTSFSPCVFRHIQVGWFHAYRRVKLGNDQQALIASPENALLDLVYLQPRGDEEDYLRSLRLQALDQLDLDQLLGQVERLPQAHHHPKTRRALN